MVGLLWEGYLREGNKSLRQSSAASSVRLSLASEQAIHVHHLVPNVVGLAFEDGDAGDDVGFESPEFARDEGDNDETGPEAGEGKGYRSHSRQQTWLQRPQLTTQTTNPNHPLPDSATTLPNHVEKEWRGPLGKR